MRVSFLTVIFILLLISCKERESIKIGYISNLTGRHSELGIRGRDGIFMVIKEYNELGGINGRNIELIIKNHQGDKELCLKRTKELVAEGVEVIISPLASSMASSVIQGTKDSNVLIISPTVSTDSLSGIDDNFLRISTVSSYQGISLGKVIEARGEKSTVVVFDGTNREYALDVIKGLKDVTSGSVESLSFNSRDQIPELLKNLEEKDMDSILFITTGIDAAQIIQNLNKIKDLPSLYGSSWVKVTNITRHGGRIIDGMIITDNFKASFESDRELNFLNRFKKLYSIEPTLPAVYSYEATKLFLDIKTSYPEIYGTDLKEHLLSLKIIKGVSDNFHFDRFGDVQRDISLITIKEGKYEPLRTTK